MVNKRKALPDLSPRVVSPDEPDARGRTHSPPTPQQILTLAKHHGFPPDFDLQERLDDRWSWWRFDVESGPPPTGSVRREFLRELSQRAELLAEAIGKIGVADRAVMLKADLRLDLEALTRMLHHVSSASRAAMQKVPPSRPGARGRADTIELLCKLWRLYREAFGPGAARVTRVGTVYGGKFFDFADDTLRLFGVRMSNAALGKVIQKAQRAVDARDAEARMP